MASKFIGMNRGGSEAPDELTVGSSTGSTDMELRVDTGKSLTRLDVHLFLEAVERYFANVGENQIGSI